MALQMDKRMLVLIVAIVVIVAAAAAYLLTRAGGDEAQGYTVTFEDFEDAAHPDVKIEITDSEGKVIADGKAAVDGDVEFGAKITTCHEITGFTMSPADRAKLISLEKTGETDDGLVYEAKFSVTDGKDVTVGFNITFGEVAKKNTLTLTPFADPDKTGAKVEYRIGEDVVSGKLDLTEDVTVTVKVTCKDWVTDIQINSTPTGSASKAGDVNLGYDDGIFTAMVDVNVKAGQDVVLSVNPVIDKASSEPNAYIGIIADEGIKVTYGEAQFGDGDAQEVQHQRQRLAVEVAAGDNQVVVHENRRVVGHGVDFSFHNGSHVIHRVFHGAMYLRHATERIGVLHVGLLDFLKFGAFQKSADVARRFNLSRMGTSLLYLRQERVDASVVGLEGQGTDDVGIFD